MDKRVELQKNDILAFPGMECTIDRSVGRGSNVIAYVGHYKDHQNPNLSHRVLIRELFPFDKKGGITREPGGDIEIDPAAYPLYDMNRRTFVRGNEVHLRLLETIPSEIDLNINTFEYHNTLYSIVGYSGGRNLYEELARDNWMDKSLPATKLLLHIVRILKGALDVLQAFHQSGYLHLDISPDNILLIGEGEKERVTLIDYNSVHTIDEIQRKDQIYYSVKEGFTAPEVRMGRNAQIREWTDLFSMTAVLYLCLTGKKVTPSQMTGIEEISVNPSNSPFLKDCPETALSLIRRILRRGLAVTPRRRYQNVSQMRGDLTELEERIRGRGITHWALWEAGRRQVKRMILENPSLSFIQDSSALFPSMVTDENNIYPIDEYFRKTQKSCMITGGGGMGKTTALLRIAFSDNPRYTPGRPAVMYLSLYGWQSGDNSYIVNSLLKGLLYNSEVHTYEDARKALYELLDHPMKTSKGNGPVLLLLLDGLNEVSGDPEPLLNEINRLSALQGVRIVVADRTGEKTLPFQQLRITELSDDVVKEALSREGLLLPESGNMQKLLHTPMMLSLYIKSGQMEQQQVRAENSDELLKTYLSALMEKAVKDLPEQTERRWQIDAAMNLVLPAIASEVHKKQRGLEDRDLLPVVEKCYRILNGRLSRRFFPQWIGRTAAIRGEAETADGWYDVIVRDILWKQLGLILKDEQERYIISHQIIEEYLLNLDKDNLQRILRFKRIRISIFCICFAIAAALSTAVYKKYIAPPPYEEVYAENVMERALDGYVKAGKQYEQLYDLTQCASTSPESFEKQLELYKNQIPYSGMSTEQSLEYLTKMMETGDVMPWSGKSMDETACRELLTLFDNREEEYTQFASVLEYVMTDETAFRRYGREYPQLLAGLLETDADIAARLYQIVCIPHIKGKYADGSVTARSYEELYSCIPGQNAHIDYNLDVNQSKIDLAKLKGNRDDQYVDFSLYGAFDILDRNGKPEE